jgi:hypothetical protein
METGVTVKELIESLLKYPMDSTVEIAICQYNKRSALEGTIMPIAVQVPIDENPMVKGLMVTPSGNDAVRIVCTLPYSSKQYSIISKRKK